MHFVVLLKPVPETTGDEHFRPDFTVDRDAGATVINPNDEYALEAALRMAEARGGDNEVTLLTMAPPSAIDAVRKGLSMGASRGILLSDPTLEGSGALLTARVLAAALATLEYDLVLAGADSSDGRCGVVGAAVATLLSIPYLSNAATVGLADGKVQVHRASPGGSRLLEASLPALVVVTQTVGEPRYPTLRGIMTARSKEIAVFSLADIGLSSHQASAAAASTRVLGIRALSARPEPRVIVDRPHEAAAAIVDFLTERGTI